MCQLKCLFLHTSAPLNKQVNFALRRFTVGRRSKRRHLGANYGSTCLAFMVLTLIFTKAACDNVADAGWGLNFRPLKGGPLAVPLTPWTRVSNTDRQWFIWFITVFPPQQRRNGGREARMHVNVHWTETLLIIESSKKKHKSKIPLCHLFESTSREQMAYDLSCRTTTTKSHITTGLILPDMFAILMRYSVTVNKTLLFCLLVSQTTNLPSDPCCDPAHRQRTIPRGCIAVEISDVLI